MMGKYVRHLAAAGILAFAMALLYLSAAAWGRLALGKVMFRLESPVSVPEGMEVLKQAEEQKKEAEEGDPVLPDLCIWGQKEGVTVENKNLSRAAVADAIFLCGEAGLVLEGCRVPMREDGQGCVISEDAAWELFGSSQVVEKEVSCGETSYVIRQVLPIQGKIIAFQVGTAGQADGAAGQAGVTASQAGGAAGRAGVTAGQAGVTAGQAGSIAGQADGAAGQAWAEEQLDRITLKSGEGLSKSSLAGLLSMQYGLSAQLLDIELLGGISGLCMLLAPITVCVCVGMLIYRQYQKQEAWPGKAWMAGCLVLLAGISFLFIKSQVRIPEDYIPSRWSDFSFWSGLWQQKAQAVKFLVGMEKTELDDRWIYDFSKAAGYGLLAEILLVAGLACGSRSQAMARHCLPGKRSRLRSFPFPRKASSVMLE